MLPPECFLYECSRSDVGSLQPLIWEHLAGLAYPPDAWLEERLFAADLYRFRAADHELGYAALRGDMILFFYVKPRYFRSAPGILEQFVRKAQARRVYVLSHDALLSALIAEWEFDKALRACFFSDSGEQTAAEPCVPGTFRQAAAADGDSIRRLAGNFCSEACGGFHSLEQRLAAGTVFVWEVAAALVGCGLVEKSPLGLDAVSFAMFVDPAYRGRGIGTAIVMKLRQWLKQRSLRPTAGCWYYNTLSRRSLEAAGMIATSIGYEAVLRQKPSLPLQGGSALE